MMFVLYSMNVFYYTDRFPFVESSLLSGNKLIELPLLFYLGVFLYDHKWN